MAIQKKPFSVHKHGSLLLTTVFICLLIGIPLVLFFLSPQKTKTEQLYKPIVNQPTTINPPPTLTIKNIMPSQNATTAGIFTPIVVTFAQPVPLPIKVALTVNSSPLIDGTADWSDGDTIFTFSPRAPLLTNTKYTILLKSNTTTLSSWSFQTIPVESVSIEDQERSQGLADEEYNKEQAQIDKRYPWLDKLPLQTDSFYVYFDIKKKGFVAKLYPKDSSTKEVTQLKAQVFDSLNTLDLPVHNYPFFWEITPEP